MGVTFKKDGTGKNYRIKTKTKTHVNIIKKNKIFFLMLSPYKPKYPSGTILQPGNNIGVFCQSQYGI